MVHRKFTHVSCAALGQLIGLKDAASRKVSKNSVFDKENPYSRSPILLFILLNFKVSTVTGYATDLVVKDLAEGVGCCAKTVMSWLNKLSNGKKPLISYSIDEDTKLLSVNILNYQDMNKPAGKGGLRYLVVNEDLLAELKDIENINELRLLLRGLIECEEQGGREASLSMKAILSGLPSYVRPCNVRNYVEKLKKLINSASNINSSAYHFELTRFTDGKAMRNKLLGMRENAIKSAITDINYKISEINKQSSLSISDKESNMTAAVSSDVKELLNLSFDWRKAKNQNRKVLSSFNFTKKEIEDAALIAVHLGDESVIGAIYKYIEEFAFTDRCSTVKDTMAIIQNMSENIYIKNKTFSSTQNKNKNFFNNSLEAAY